MGPVDEDPRLARRRVEREKRRRRTRLRRRTILIAVPVAIIAVVVGLEVGMPGSDETSSADGPTAAEIRRAQAKQRAREEKGIDRVLEYTTFVKEGGGRKRQVALTFDDGPGAQTREILRILKRTDTPATFFMVGSMIPGQEKLIRHIERQGHDIGNHTMDHPQMGNMTAGEQISQLTGQSNLMEAAGARKQRLFRPPYRSFNDSTLEILSERELLMVLWSVDTGDYVGLGSQDIVRKALDDVKPGSIILMHDAGGDRSDTAKALPDIIKGLKRRKLEPVTVSQMMLNDPPPDGQRLPDELSGS